MKFMRWDLLRGNQRNSTLFTWDMVKTYVYFKVWTEDVVSHKVMTNDLVTPYDLGAL